jgi:hypothetical protein
MMLAIFRRHFGLITPDSANPRMFSSLQIPGIGNQSELVTTELLIG